jgi:hypothetical protein
LMCVTPAGKIGNCTCGMPEIVATFGQKKAAFFTLFHQSKTVSSQFLLLPICRQEGIWSFEYSDRHGERIRSNFGSCPGSVAWHRHPSSEFQASNVGLIIADRVNAVGNEVRASGRWNGTYQEWGGGVCGYDLGRSVIASVQTPITPKW